MTDPKILEGIHDALLRDPGNMPLWIHYSELLEQNAQKVEALEALRTAIQSDRDEAALGERFIRLLRKCGKLHEALIRAEKLLEKADDPALRLELARVLLARGEKDEASEHYAAAIRKDPRLKNREFEGAIDGRKDESRRVDESGRANKSGRADDPGRPDDPGRSKGPVERNRGRVYDDGDPIPFTDPRKPANRGSHSTSDDDFKGDPLDAESDSETASEFDALSESDANSDSDAVSDADPDVDDFDDSDSGSDAHDSEVEEALAAIAPDPMNTEEWAAQFDWEGLCVTFDDVAGLDDVKRQIDLRIIAPFKKPEIYRAFRRQGGGGLMLYGPPGCGKTYIAKATADELDARFLAVSLHEVIDKYWGESEKMVHAIFQEARLQTPAVLFFDEFDALGSSRGKSDSQFFRTLVNQLLQEMDGIEGQNDNILLFAATNMPWTVDPAFRRPGRFDRVLFVPPPDRAARAQILKIHTRKVPGGDKIPVDKLAKETTLMTGADLKALCEQAVEYALERSLSGGKIESVTAADFKQALKQVRSSAMEWLSTAKNYAKYANEAGYYDELAEFLRKCKRW